MKLFYCWYSVSQDENIPFDFLSRLSLLFLLLFFQPIFGCRFLSVYLTFSIPLVTHHNSFHCFILLLFLSLMLMFKHSGCSVWFLLVSYDNSFHCFFSLIYFSILFFKRFTCLALYYYNCRAKVDFIYLGTISRLFIGIYITKPIYFKNPAILQPSCIVNSRFCFNKAKLLRSNSLFLL